MRPSQTQANACGAWLKVTSKAKLTRHQHGLQSAPGGIQGPCSRSSSHSLSFSFTFWHQHSHSRSPFNPSHFTHAHSRPYSHSHSHSHSLTHSTHSLTYSILLRSLTLAMIITHARTLSLRYSVTQCWRDSWSVLGCSSFDLK